VGDDHTARFEALYAATFTPILGYAVRRCESADDAADVVAETFAIAWRRIDTVPPGDRARLWLYRVAGNVLANQRRGANRRRGLAVTLAAQLAGLYEPSAEDRFATGELGRIFRQLPDGDREVLSLVAWEGLDHGEIAAVLGCSRVTVRSRLHRARKRLARDLATAGVSTRWLVTSRSTP
jgi:RNA polymerase sigma-70 factor (ECF subfamily)